MWINVGTSIDQGIAYVLMLLALALTYIISIRLPPQFLFLLVLAYCNYLIVKNLSVRCSVPLRSLLRPNVQLLLVMRSDNSKNSILFGQYMITGFWRQLRNLKTMIVSRIIICNRILTLTIVHIKLVHTSVGRRRQAQLENSAVSSSTPIYPMGYNNQQPM